MGFLNIVHSRQRRPHATFDPLEDPRICVCKRKCARKEHLLGHPCKCVRSAMEAIEIVTSGKLCDPGDMENTIIGLKASILKNCRLLDEPSKQQPKSFGISALSQLNVQKATPAVDAEHFEIICTSTSDTRAQRAIFRRHRRGQITAARGSEAM